MATHHRWALAAAAAVGVAVLSVQQTGALWSDSADLGGATITSGRLDIAVGTAGTKVEAYQFTDLAKANMVSGDYVQRPLYVHNTGNIPMEYRLESAALSDSLPLQLSVTQVSSEAGCPASGDAAGELLFSGEMASAQTGNQHLDAGASEILCFRATMGTNPPAGGSATAVFTFRATQS